MRMNWLVPVILFLILPFGLSSSSRKVLQIVDRLARESGLPPPSGLKLRFVRSSELEDVFWRDFTTRHPREILVFESRLLRAIGLFQGEVDLTAQFEKVVRGNIKAYFQRETAQLLIDQSLPFEDEYSLGALIVEIRKAMTRRTDPGAGARPGRFFSDENWMEYALYTGDASFVMHQYYGDNAEILSSMDGMSLISKDPLVSAASGFKVEPVIGLFFTQGLIQGVKQAGRAYGRKKWKGLNQRLDTPPAGVLDYWLEKPLKTPLPQRIPEIPPLSGFDVLRDGQAGIFLLSYLLDKTPLALMTEFGCCGESFSLDRDRETGGELLRWKMAWMDEKSARDALITLCDRYEVLLACRFEDGAREGKAFRAGRDQWGAYVMVRQDGWDTQLIRSFDRKTINRFIEGGEY